MSGARGLTIMAGFFIRPRIHRDQRRIEHLAGVLLQARQHRDGELDLSARQASVLVSVYLEPQPHTVRALAAFLGGLVRSSR